nr:Chain C, Putative exported peptide YydF [Bacillus subtilis]8AI2_D Chain D, Putative exported peptide YydF [Bacillus subtilis]8AI4_C Chain C, Putative exported peptide YydF [Bacillus subtilis]8AI4_D Chain D, Putative exported peptide YydF [Bacillus subtilis]
FVKSKENRWIL